jgi:hypothetical protein
MTVADWGSVAVALVILVNTALRVAKGRPNVRLLKASLAMIIPLMGSISVVFYLVDPLLGGLSFLNLFTHLVMLYCEWSVSKAAEGTLQTLAPKDYRPLLLRRWVPLVALVGTIASFLWLSPGSSRGLSEYGDHPAYVAYWAFTLLPLVLPAFHLVPRTWMARHVLGVPGLVRAALGLLMLSFAGSVVLAAAYAAAAVFPELAVARDVLATVVLMLFALSLLVATAALPPAGERPCRQDRPQSNRAPRQPRYDALGTPATR